MKTVEFYYDFSSPMAYLGYFRLRDIAKKTGATIVYKTMLLGAVHKGSGNTAPGLVAAKGAYMLNFDIPRYAKKYEIDFKFNPHFPVNCMNALRGAIFLEGKDDEELFREVMYKAAWKDGKNIADLDVFKEIMADAGIAPGPVLTGIADESVKQKLKDNTAEAISRGVFGAPTFYIGDEMFFGQDRLDFVEEMLS